MVQQPRSHVWAHDRKRRPRGVGGGEDEGVECLVMGMDMPVGDTEVVWFNQVVVSNVVGRMSSRGRG